MRRKVKNRIKAKPDIKYSSDEVGRFINYIMLHGKKSVAEKIVYSAFDEIKEKAKAEDPVAIFDEAMKNVGPTIEVRSRRVGGANYQVPVEVRPERREALAMRWIIGAAKSKKGSPIHTRLASELLLASKNEGEAVRKRENVHKMAEANRAFAHFAW